MEIIESLIGGFIGGIVGAIVFMLLKRRGDANRISKKS